MALLEAFRRSAAGPILDADWFEIFLLACLDGLLSALRPVTPKMLKDFRSAGISIWCPRGDTTLLALTLQALDGQVPTRGTVWTKAAEMRLVAVLNSLSQAKSQSASVG
jgi:hypothetical protein